MAWCVLPSPVGLVTRLPEESVSEHSGGCCSCRREVSGAGRSQVGTAALQSSGLSPGSPRGGTPENPSSVSHAACGNGGEQCQACPLPGG